MPEERELLTWHISERLKETIWKEIGSSEQWEVCARKRRFCHHTLKCCIAA